MKGELGVVIGLISAVVSFGQTTESPSVVPVGQYWVESDLMAWARPEAGYR